MRSGAQLHGPHGFKGEEYGKRDVYSARISMHYVVYSRDIPSSPLDILYCNMYFLYILSCIDCICIPSSPLDILYSLMYSIMHFSYIVGRP